MPRNSVVYATCIVNTMTWLCSISIQSCIRILCSSTVFSHVFAFPIVNTLLVWWLVTFGSKWSILSYQVHWWSLVLIILLVVVAWITFTLNVLINQLLSCGDLLWDLWTDFTVIVMITASSVLGISLTVVMHSLWKQKQTDYFFLEIYCVLL